eukprot:GAHX01000618.1.p1 GENE.GAHX01000618.1~~GAHX01000618.1.p1  ORF type:complete len:831 (-),score=207.66 GAHX01000618.1:48-2540(-)
MTEIREFDLNILNSGLSPYELSEKERSYFPEVEDNNKFIFCEIRNCLLNQWQRNLNTPTVIEDLNSIYCVSKYTELTQKIFTYLNVFSHINHGYLNHSFKTLTNFPAIDFTRKICIVGSGVAGLCILNKLLFLGYQNITVLEAEDRIGGRIKYTELDGERIDLGASIVNGLTGNPLNVLLKQTAQLSNLHRINPDTAIYSKQTKKTIDSQKDAKITALWNNVLDLTNKMYEDEENENNKSLADRIVEVLDTHYKDIKLDSEETSLFLWFVANLEYANCTNLNNVSGSKWDQDDAYEFTGTHTFLKSSYSCLTDALAKEKYIQLNREVSCVEVLKDKVNITHLDNNKQNDIKEEIESFDVAFVTVPIGVLKKNYITFKPDLPTEKLKAINNIGAGVMNKVILHFNNCFWDKQSHGDSFGVLNYFNNEEVKENELEDLNVPWLKKLQQEIRTDNKERGFIHIFWNFQRVVNKPILVALCSGESANNLHKKTQQELIEESFALLKHCFENAEKPIKVVVTNWGNDKHFHTSYSYMGKDACSEDYEALKTPVENRLYFAGEHTSRKHPATVAGAYLSGLSAASRFLTNPKMNNSVYTLLTTKISNAGSVNSAEQIETLNKENHVFLEAQESLMLSEGVKGRGNLKGIQKEEHTVESLRMRNILKDLLFDESDNITNNNFYDDNQNSENDASKIETVESRRGMSMVDVRDHLDKLYHKMDKERIIEEKLNRNKVESLDSFLRTEKRKGENKIDKKSVYKSFIKFIYKALEKRKVKNIDVINKLTKKVSKESMKIYLKDNNKFESKYQKNLKLSKFMNKKNIENICKIIDNDLSKY